MLTEKEAWREIGDAFEARAQHPDLKTDYRTDLAFDGLCGGISKLFDRQAIDNNVHTAMGERVNHEVLSPENRAAGGYIFYLAPQPHIHGGPEFRAALAYLFAEAAE